MAKKKGRPAFEVTDEQRMQVKTLAGYGLNQNQIASILEITRQTLAKHFSVELEKGKSLALAQAASSLFNNIKKGKEASIFFYLKTQGGWREQQQQPDNAQTVNFHYHGSGRPERYAKKDKDGTNDE